MIARLTAILALCLGPLAVADDAPLALADLEAYQEALVHRSTGQVPSVGFRDLWDRPGDYVGREVRVAGRVARVFRQPPIGAFPALVEAWVVAPSGDPFCLVFPATAGGDKTRIGETVAFAGTYLKRLRYHGGDVDRLAPLLVGPKAPDRTDPGGSPSFAWPGSGLDAAVGLGGALIVALFLARRHLSRPPARPIERGPDPVFEDGGSPDDDDRA